MSYPGYPDPNPTYPPYPGGSGPQGYPPQYGAPGYNVYPPPPPNVGFNVGQMEYPMPGYPPTPQGYPGMPPVGYPGMAPVGYPGIAPAFQPYPPVQIPNPALYNAGNVRVEEVTTTVYHPSAPYNPHMGAEMVGAVAGAEHVAHEVHEEKKEIHEEKEEIHEEKKEIHEEKKVDEVVEQLEKEIIVDIKHDEKIEEHHEDKKETEHLYEEHHETEGTIKEHHPFEPKEDAAALKKAMKGFGTKEKLIIDILTSRTYEQREKIALEYKTSFGKDLVNSLKKELGGHFEDAVLALMTPRAKYLASCLHSAIAGAGTKDRVLIEILCSASNKEIHKINEHFKEMYGKPLEKAIAGDTSGYFQKLLVAIDVGNRDESHEISHERAVKDAEAMYQAGEKKMGTNESVFSQIIVSQSYPQLRAAFEEYEKLYHHPIEEALKKEMSGDLQDAMLSLVGCIKNKEKFFAQQLNNAMKGMGTKDHTLIRIIVTRSEIDLQQIKEEFHHNYKKTLQAAVKSEARGDYEKVLLAIIK